MKYKPFLVCVFGFFLVFFVGSWLAGSLLSAPANRSVGSLPTDVSGTAVVFPSASGATIHGWFIAGTQGQGTVILLHGVRADRRSMLGRARFLAHAGYSVLLFDFQAHGESIGTHITFGYLESRDVQAAIRFLRNPSPGGKIGVVGVSLGGAAALLALPPLEVDAIVVEMAYSTLTQAITNRLTMRLGDWSTVLTPILSWQLKPRLGIDVAALRPVETVRDVTAPTLFIAGTEDQHTTVQESYALFNAAREPKELWIINGAQHVDLYALAKAEYEQRVLTFLGQHLR